MQFFDDMPAGREARERRVDWESAKAELINNPGRWGLMAENIASSIPDQLRKGRYKDFRGNDLEVFQFRVLKPSGEKGKGYGARRTDLYGRFTPEGFGYDKDGKMTLLSRLSRNRSDK